VSLEDEVKKLRNDVQRLQEQLRNRRPDPILLPPGGIWAWLAPGQGVTAASGPTKGTGLVTLFEADGVTPRTGAGSTLEVKNAGGGVAGGSAGYLVKLGRMDGGGFSLDVAPCAAAVS
jgi:hypothetical protein